MAAGSGTGCPQRLSISVICELYIAKLLIFTRLRRDGLGAEGRPFSLCHYGVVMMSC